MFLHVFFQKKHIVFDYKMQSETRPLCEVWAFLRRVGRYEPSLTTRIHSMVLTPTEQVFASGLMCRSDDFPFSDEFVDSLLWRNYEQTKILAGSCDQLSETSFSFLINGPKNSVFYKHVLRVSIIGKAAETRKQNVQVVLWPSRTTIFHANCVGKSMFYHFLDRRFQPDVPGAQILHFATRVSVLLALPDPEERTFFALPVIPDVEQYLDRVDYAQQNGTSKGFDDDDPVDPCMRAKAIWMSSDERLRFDYFEAALYFTDLASDTCFVRDDYMPRKTYFLDTSESAEDEDMDADSMSEDGGDDSRYIERETVAMDLRAMLPDGEIVTLCNVKTVRDVREAVGEMDKCGPWTLLAVVHQGIVLGYSTPDDGLSALQVSANDLVVIDKRNWMPAV